MGTIYREAPLSEKKPFLRHIASDFVLDGHKIYPKYREPFNIFAQGNKKCLEIKGKYPKSSKHLIWGSLLEYFYNFFSTNVIYWHILLSRRERTLKNGQKGPSYNFLQGGLNS